MHLYVLIFKYIYIYTCMYIYIFKDTCICFQHMCFNLLNRYVYVWKLKHKHKRMFLYNCRNINRIDTILLSNCQCVATCLPSNHVWLEQKMRPLHLDVLTCAKTICVPLFLLGHLTTELSKNVAVQNSMVYQLYFLLKQQIARVNVPF
jgi:hypothetical protein